MRARDARRRINPLWIGAALAAVTFVGCSDDDDGIDAEVLLYEVQDWEYVQGKFFFLTDPDGPALDVDIASVEVWIDDRDGSNNNEQVTISGYVTLDGTFQPDSLRDRGDFNQLLRNDDYIVQENVYTGYPVLILNDSQVLDSRMTKAMAVRYASKSGEQVGGWRGSKPDSLLLKLIRPAAEMGGTNPYDLTRGIFAPTRKLEMRNIYDLGSDLDWDRHIIRIRRKITEGGVVNPDRIGDHTFLEILGLDLFTGAGSDQKPGPDGRIDQDRIELTSGWVIFRELQPFDPTPEDIARRFIYERPDTLQAAETASCLYRRNDWTVGDPEDCSQYKFEVTMTGTAPRTRPGFSPR